MDLVARVVARYKEAAEEKEADSASNRVRNVKPWLQSAGRELKRAEQVLQGVQKEFETFHKGKDAIRAITDLTERVAKVRHGAETVSKDIDAFARRYK